MASNHAHPEQEKIVDETVEALRNRINLKEEFLSSSGELRRIVKQGIARGALLGVNTAWNADAEHLRAQLVKEVDCSAAGRNMYGETAQSNTSTGLWSEWYPGLDNDSMTLREIRAVLPGFDQKDIPKIVRLFENPESPVALPGAVTLERHDAIHFVLGRGLLDQDEAFVLGFTIGTNRTATESDIDALRSALGVYPEPYQIREGDVKAFDLGVRAGRISGVNDIASVELEKDLDITLGELRAKLGINKELLREFYKLEQQVIQDTPASARLPV